MVLTLILKPVAAVLGVVEGTAGTLKRAITGGPDERVRWHNKFTKELLTVPCQMGALYALLKIGVIEDLRAAFPNTVSVASLARKHKIDEENLHHAMLSLGSGGMIVYTTDGDFKLASKVMDKEFLEVLFKQADFALTMNFRQMYYLEESLRTRRNVGGLEIVQPTFRTDKELKYLSLYDAQKDFPENYKAWSTQMDFVTNTVDKLWLPLVKMHGKVLDIAGQDGEGAERLLSLYPECQVTIFDLPFKKKRVEARFAGTKHKVDFIGGNIFESTVSGVFDFVMIKHFLDMWAQKEQKVLLEKAYKALKPGGTLILVHPHYHEDWEKNIDSEITAFIGPYFMSSTLGWGGTSKPSWVYNLLEQQGFDRKKITKQWMHAGANDGPCLAGPGHFAHEMIIRAIK